MKSLYDDDYKTTDDGGQLFKDIQPAIKEVFEKYIKLGYSPREISHIVQSVVTHTEVFMILDNSSKES